MFISERMTVTNEVMENTWIRIMPRMHSPRPCEAWPARQCGWLVRAWVRRWSSGLHLPIGRRLFPTDYGKIRYNQIGSLITKQASHSVWEAFLQKLQTKSLLNLKGIFDRISNTICGSEISFNITYQLPRCQWDIVETSVRYSSIVEHEIIWFVRSSTDDRHHYPHVN